MSKVPFNCPDQQGTQRWTEFAHTYAHSRGLTAELAADLEYCFREAIHECDAGNGGINRTSHFLVEVDLWSGEFEVWRILE